jgi:hypothetical protein
MIPYFQRVKYAFRSFFSILDYSRIPEDIAAALAQTPVNALRSAPPAPQPEPAGRATQLLTLLQRDGRLVDFLMEDLAPYSDAQVGASVRDVHAGCRTVLTRYLSIVPVMDEQEGETVMVDRGADLARVKIVGNLAGQPPYRAILRHRGWDAVHVELPPVPPAGGTIIAPAEVEVQ